MHCKIYFRLILRASRKEKCPHLNYNMLLCHHSLRLGLISDLLKGGRDVHLEINEIQHMKTVALLRFIKRNTVFEKFKSWAGIFKYAKDMGEVRSPSLMLSTFRVLLIM